MAIRKRNRTGPSYVASIHALEGRVLLSAAFDITGLTALRADAAFSSITGVGVGIAVLDTGVDAANPDLTPNVEAFYNAVEDPVDTTSIAASGAIDNDGHGSHVSGIAASSDPSIGVAYGAKLVDIKVIADSGESQLGGDPLLRGLEWVAANYLTYNIKVVNMSLGESGVNDNTVTAADAADAEAVEIKALEKLGITVVSASGNSYANDPTAGESFPAIVSTIGVANTWATTGQASDFGVPYGESGDQYYAVDYSATPDTLASTSQRSTVANQLAAPGEDIYSDWNGTLDSSNGSDLMHNTISGTSMATPFVSGVVALMQNAAKYFGGHYISDPTEILQILDQTADTVVDSNNPNNARYDSNTGATTNLPETGLSFKRVDVLKAIEEVEKVVTGGSITTGPAPGADTDNTAATATPVNSIDGTTVYTFGGSIGTDGLVQVGDNDVDLFKLDVTSTGQMTFTLTAATGGTAFAGSLRLFDAQGNVIASANGTASVYPTLATTGALAIGTYYLGISSVGNNSYTINGTGAANGGAMGDYSLQIQLANPDPNGTIQGAVSVDLTEPDQVLTDPNTGADYTAVLQQGELGSDPPPTGSDTRITVASDVDMFEVTAPDNGTLTLTTESDGFSGDTTFLKIFDGTGAPLKSSTGTGSENVLTYKVTSGDAYYVAVTIPGNSSFNPTDPYVGREANGTPFNQAYNLYFRFDNGDSNGTALNPTSANIGTPLTANIGADSGVTVGSTGSKDVDWYSYTPSQDGIFNISAQSSTSGFTPVITLWEYTNGDSNIVKVADTSSSSLFASPASEFAAGTASINALGSASLEDEVSGGQSFFVAITGQGDSNFNWYALASGGGGETGNYSLSTQLQSLSALKTLSDNSIDGGSPEAITAGQTINANLGADGNLVVGSTDVDLYKYVAAANGTIDARTYTNQEGDADTVLRAFDSSGNQLAANDNIDSTTTASEVKFSVVAGQTYYIGVDGAGTGALQYNPLTGANAGTGSTGNYSLSLSTVTPGFSISTPAAIQGTTGGTMVFTVTLDQALSASATVDYATADGTAIAGADYTAQSGTLTFPAGTTSQTISIAILANNSAASGARTFTLTLSNPVGAIIDSASATGTIDEGATVTPAVSVNTPAAVSGDLGGNVLFDVSLSAASATTVTIDYATADGTAVAGTDYTAEAGTLTFAPGEVTQTISVPVLANTAATSGTLTFTLTLSNPSGLTIATSTATGTIDDSPATTLTFSAGKAAKYRDSAGKPVTLILAGPGTGTAVFVNGAADPAQITLDSTTAASTFTVRSAQSLLGEIVVTGSLATINAGSATLSGDLNIAGSIRKLIVGRVTGLTGGSTISIGSGTTAITFGGVDNASLDSAGTISALKVSSWLDSQAISENLSAAAIGSIAVKGDFAASLVTAAAANVRIGGSLTAGAWSLTQGIASLFVGHAAEAAWSGTFGGSLGNVRFGSDSGTLTAAAIKHLTIAGDLADATINLTGTGATLGTFTVGQAVTSSQIRSDGNIGAVSVGAFQDSTLFAGVEPIVTTLPTTTADLETQNSIVSFTVTGKSRPYSFSNSFIAATHIGKVALSRVNPNNGGIAFGVATETLGNFTNTGVLKWKSKQSASLLKADGDLVVSIL